jgi:histidyl-tRNA synthetase
MTRPARGMRDFLPEDVRRREYVVATVERVYRRYGFEPLETPALENVETLTGKYGEEGNKLIFKVLRRGEQEASGETDLALRYDLTVPLARVVAEHRGKLPRFFKRYQIQPVWRADRPARGRFREFYQCDVDAIGSRSMVVEAEVCSAVSDVLTELGFADFVIRLNHRAVLAGLLETCGVGPAQQTDALIALDKRDKIGREGVARELVARGIEEATARRLVAAFDEVGHSGDAGGGTGKAADNAAKLALLTERLAAHEQGAQGVSELKQIVSLSASTAAGPHVRLDPSLARGLSYYTGAIMEIAVSDIAGSLGGGGRYDGLIGMFLGEQIPACGFSLGLERILVVMAERKMFPPGIESAAADAMVALFEGQPIEDALQLASHLRAAGLRVDVYPEPDKLGKQFKYAAATRVRYVAIVGEDERAAGQVTLKNMETGVQQRVSRADVAHAIAEARTLNRALNLEH